MLLMAAKKSDGITILETLDFSQVRQLLSGVRLRPEQQKVVKEISDRLAAEATATAKQRRKSEAKG